MTKLIFGCGYLGRRVARLWIDRGERVHAVTRSPARGRDLLADGIVPIVADATDRQSLKQAEWPRGPSTVLFAVGYERGSSRSIFEVFVQGLANAIDTMPESVSRFILTSSTGVYGDAAGEWIDEETPASPLREGGLASLAAEGRLRESRFGDLAIVLRMAGLYGPGRIPRADSLIRGEPIDAPLEGYLNLIHVDDAAAIVLLAEERAPLPRTYIVSDGQPVIRGDYYRELAHLLAAPPARFVAPGPDAPSASRAIADKRASNRRLVRELSPSFRYPSYREGLAAIVAQRQNGIENGSN